MRLQISALLILLVAAPTLAQDTPPPRLGDVLRELEQLKRDVAKLTEEVRLRDTFINLAVREREMILREMTADKGAAKATADRCQVLERQLRAIESPEKESTFDCDTLTFKGKPAP